jgi:tetratricopeptide (TPR) repeat protein
VELDPNYALGHAGLARCYVVLENLGALPGAEAYDLAWKAAVRAIELEDTLPEAYAVQGEIKHFHDRDWTAAEAAFHRAIELNPSYGFAHMRYGFLLASEGRLAEAMREARRAEEVEPLDASTRTSVGTMMYYARDYNQAIEQYKRVLAIDPNLRTAHLQLGRTYAEKQMFHEALEEVRRARELSSDDDPGPIAELGRVYAAAGMRAEAASIIGDLQEGTRQRRFLAAPQQFAYIQIALGNNDSAFEWLNRAVDARMSGVLWAKVDPRVDPLRRDARFPAFVRRLGLEP